MNPAQRLFVSHMRQFPKYRRDQANTVIIAFAARSTNIVLLEADGAEQPEIQSVT